MNTFNTTNLNNISESSNTVNLHGTGSTNRPSVGRQIVMAVVLLAVVAAIALIGSLSTMQHVDGWYAEASKAPWSPPNAVFGPVWSVLYAAIALIGFLIWRAGFVGSGRVNRARGTLWLYAVQLLLNFAWTPMFFAGYPTLGETAWWLAFAIIVALIIAVIWLMVAASRWSKTATWLLVPYLVWLMFAATLNAGIIALNEQAG